MFIASVALLAVAHYASDPSGLSRYLPAVAGGDAVLWQVQTAFLSVGFAGLAIAAQLFADAPLAIGASRGRVLAYIDAGWFAGLGLVGNAVMAVETIWLPSNFGVLGIFLWFTVTVVMLAVSTTRLMRLFGHPSRLDEVVRLSLVETQSTRLREASREYADAKRQLEGLSVADWSVKVGSPNASSVTLRVPVPEPGRVIKAIRPKGVRQAIASLSLRATEDGMASNDPAEVSEPPQITIDVEPGDRTRLGETAFRVVTSKELDEATTGRIVRLLQSSIEFEPVGSVTRDEETNREIANLKDAIGTSLRSGAHATAERALELLGHVVRGVWMAEPANSDASRRASFVRRDWLFRSVGEVERDAPLSPLVADIFVSAAMTRALEAPRTDSTEYVDECLRSFTRLWFDVLRGGPGFDAVASRITTCVQDLAAYSYTAADDRADLQARGTWAMVELVKLALDAKRPDAAKMAASELNGLFEFDREGSGRSHVRGGQLVLSGWLDYLADKRDERHQSDSDLRALLTPRGTWAEILTARGLAERGAAPFSRWDWWEINTTASSRAQVLQLSGYIDRVQLAALASSYGTLPPADTQETASEYKRFLRLLDQSDKELTTRETNLRDKLAAEVAKWDAAEDGRLAQEPLSAERVEALRTALRDSLAERPRLASEIPDVEHVPVSADTSLPILGMNFRVPRHYLVGRVFNQTHADPMELGRIIAQGFMEGEDQKIVDELRSLQANVLKPTAKAIRQQIEELGSEAEHYVLVTPFGGMDDIHEWYSPGFADALARVTHVETGLLDAEGILFDRRNALASCRKPELKEGLARVEGTSVALGVFQDVQGGDEPQVRIETGEYFVVWPGEDPRVFRFGSEATRDKSDSIDPDSININGHDAASA